ncbi:hypothetical protein I3760_15G141600 [Carya illinoinensis]|nr:hypothetical protein I3760_15G141600 [Carya illinoinensis]
MLEAIALGSRSRCNCRRPAKFSYLWMKYQWMLPSVKTTTSKLFTLGHLNYILQLQQLKTLSLGAYSGLGELRKK